VTSEFGDMPCSGIDLIIEHGFRCYLCFMLCQNSIEKKTQT